MPADQPVPILSKDTDAPIQDIERFVNRSIEARRKEVEGKNGYRPRPMNNFMLYRKAYQEKAKQVSSQNNHQVVSVIVAASWKNEPAEVKDKFAKYAQIEKDNHILAFPDYQFRPNKSQKPKKRKPGFDTDDDSWADLDDTNDPEWGRSSSKRPRPRQTKQTVYDQDYGFSTDFGQPAYGIPYHSDPRSTFGTLSPAKPSPIPIHEQAQDMYYNNRLPNPYQDLQFDDAQWISGRVNVPFPSHTSALPGTGDALLNPDDFGPVVHYDTSHLSRLDPLLVTEDTGANGAFTQSAFENLNNLGLESGWEDHRPSLSGAILTAGQNESAVYDEEQFAQFLKS
ncbi:MAG: hypothetical protein LQ340_004442 [Diploschistes diacapsis]|nr:MAG: hypothetical protein LQ340_004442 [Diploschistes diacapsis]